MTGQHRALSPCALVLALAATGTALALSVLAGWQRGGWMVERLAWVAIGAVLVLSAHLLPALGRAAPRGVRCVGGLLWAACMMAAGYGHAAFFLLSQQHAGEVRADAVTPPVAVTTVTVAPTAPVSAPGRSRTAIAAERAIVIPALAAANARHCMGDCAALRVSRVSLAARLDALNTEAEEAKRREALEDWRRTQAERDRALRETLRGDPVTIRLSGLLGTPVARVDLLSGLAFAAVLEGVACLLWLLALPGRDSESVSPVTPSPPQPSVAVIASNAEVTASHEVLTPLAITTKPSPNRAGLPDDLARLAREIAAGRIRPTVAEIRRYLGCSQARASALRRQLGPATTRQ